MSKLMFLKINFYEFINVNLYNTYRSTVLVIDSLFLYCCVLFGFRIILLFDGGFIQGGFVAVVSVRF